MGIKKAHKIITEINDKISSWDNYANQVNVKSELRDSIKGTLLFMDEDI